VFKDQAYVSSEPHCLCGVHSDKHLILVEELVELKGRGVLGHRDIACSAYVAEVFRSKCVCDKTRVLSVESALTIAR
jgi:hypothetical protein